MIAALAGIVLGHALQLQQAWLFHWAAYLFLLAAGAGLWWRMAGLHGLRWRLPLLCAAFAALAFGVTGLRAGFFLQGALAPALEGRDAAVTGVVEAMPQRSETGLRFRLAVESARLDGREVAVPPVLYLGWYSGAWGGGGIEAPLEDAQRQPADLRAGERWQMTVRLKAPHGAANPHGFDYELWLWEQGVQATGYVRAGPKDPPPQRVGVTWQHPVELARQSVRDAIFARVADRKLAGVIAALVVGDQGAIDRADWDTYRATGVAHLMSISGLHITMFAWLAAACVGWLWRRSARLCLRFPAPSAGLAGGVLLAAAYAVFSGWGVPSQRTVWMLFTVALLRLAGRRWPWPHVWLLAMAVVTTADPWALMQAGFWLSFVAVGVLFATDAGARGPQDATLRTQPVIHRAAHWFSSHLRQSFREQCIVTLALTPLTLLLFQQISVVGLAANALAIPWVTLVVTPLSMLGAFFAPIWDAAAWSVQLLGLYLEQLARLPFATLSAPAPPLYLSAAAVAGGLLVAMPWPWSARLLGLPLLLPALLWQAPRPAPGEFELLAADIGQGNAVLVRTAGHALLFDTGPRFGPESDAGSRMLVPLLRALDERLDTVVLSHRDADHIGGAPAVLAMQPQAALVSSIEDDHPLQSLRRSTRCVQGQAWDWDGVRFEVLRPLAADYDAQTKSNAMSCVLRISSTGPLPRVALLAGDIEKPQEDDLVGAYGQGLKSSVLLVPHHGSKTSSSAAFLDTVQPDIAMVQAGYRNRFGHPAAPVLERYAQRHVRVVDSPHCGAASWSSADPQTLRCRREDARRYWHHHVP